MVKKILIIFSLLGFASCSSPYLSIGSMGAVTLGDPYSKYEDEDGTFDVDVLADYKIDDMKEGKNFRILLFEQFIYETNHLFIIPLLVNKKEYTIAAMAFENDRLIFVGLPEDFLKNDDTKINELGKRLQPLIEENL